MFLAWCFSQCSASCGGGLQRRLIKCVNTDAGTEREVEQVQCELEKQPENTQKCNLQECERPPAGEWMNVEIWEKSAAPFHAAIFWTFSFPFLRKVWCQSVRFCPLQLAEYCLTLIVTPSLFQRPSMYPRALYNGLSFTDAHKHWYTNSCCSARCCHLDAVEWMHESHSRPGAFFFLCVIALDRYNTLWC